MKRKLTFLLFLTFTIAAVAQTPTVVEKPVAKAPVSAAKPAATQTKTAQTKTASSKPSPATVKVGAVTTQKPLATTAKPAAVAVKSTAAKPAVVAVQPAAVKPAAVPAKVVAVPGAKTNPSPTAKVAAVPGVKVNPASTVKPVAVGKPVPQLVPTANSGRAMVAAPMARASGPSKATAVTVNGSASKVALKPAAPQAKTKDPFSSGKKVQAVTAKATPVAVRDTKAVAETKKPESKKISAAGRRDPFISPVVALGAIGSGCSSGKRCLAIDQIALKGVVRSDNGMIAVVVNAMDKAYFLRENDPVFNGYVVKITGDSIVFKETFKDKLGKPLTRDVTKSISRPVA
jgi:Tfp pilus assembly protein PilP